MSFEANRWKPGQSGNPAGAAKRKISKLARVHSHEAVTKLVHLMRQGGKEEVQLKAALAILERAFGKPTQPIEDVNATRSLREMTLDELLSLARDSGSGES